jgi:hypothetical protein
MTMNAVHPMTYDVVKFEQQEQLARLHRRNQAASHARPAQPRLGLVRPTLLMRRLALAAASALLMLAMIGSAVLAANAPAPASGGGQNAPAGGGGGGAVYLLR